MQDSFRINGSGGCNVTLGQHLTSEDSSVRHPLGRPDENVFFGSGSTGIFYVQRQN
jgi:hypothetical protein